MTPIEYKKLLRNNNIAAMFKGDTKIWPLKAPSIDYTIPFYIENTTDNFRRSSIYCAEHYYGSGQTDFDLYTSPDNVNWTLAHSFDVSVHSDPYTVEMTPHSRLYMKAENVSLGAWYRPEEADYTLFYNTRITNVVKVGGNILSLFYGTSFTGNERSFPTSTSGCHCMELFAGTSDNHNTSLVDASELIIPVTTLYTCSLMGMFKYCKNLKYPPILEFTAFNHSTYIYDSFEHGRYYDQCASMFAGCDSLEYAPTLAAQTLDNYCYYYMFSGCDRLKQVKCLATTNINTNNSTSNWLSAVAANGIFVKDTNATWPSGANGIPSSWTVQNV